jgi:hypothetical protein
VGKRGIFTTEDAEKKRRTTKNSPQRTQRAQRRKYGEEEIERKEKERRVHHRDQREEKIKNDWIKKLRERNSDSLLNFVYSSLFLSFPLFSSLFLSFPLFSSLFLSFPLFSSPYFLLCALCVLCGEFFVVLETLQALTEFTGNLWS